MSQVIFVRTRHDYGSYVDFFQLARLAGYRVIYVDEMLHHDAKDVTFIISPVNGEWNTRPKGYTQGRVILWMLEWNVDGEHNVPDCVDVVWNSDPVHARKNGFCYVPMGGDSGLNECEFDKLPKVYEVAQLSYQTPRRQIVTLQMKSEGLTLAPNSGLWGTVRSTVLLQSEVMLHVHQLEETRGIAPLRWCLAAAHNLPMITESIPDRGIFSPSYMTQADYPFLAEFTAHMLKDKQMLADYALNLHNLLCVDYTFRRSIESHV
jgi:hypothetical protein